MICIDTPRESYSVLNGPVLDPHKVIDALSRTVGIAQSRGIQVIGCTLPPAYGLGNSDRARAWEAARTAVNE
jgi:hypothetical protein